MLKAVVRNETEQLRVRASALCQEARKMLDAAPDESECIVVAGEKLWLKSQPDGTVALSGEVGEVAFSHRTKVKDRLAHHQEPSGAPRYELTMAKYSTTVHLDLALDPMSVGPVDLVATVHHAAQHMKKVRAETLKGLIERRR